MSLHRAPPSFVRPFKRAEPAHTPCSRCARAEEPHTWPPSDIGFEVVDSVEKRALAREAAAASLVLLQNGGEPALLPLPTNATAQFRALAVVGEHTGGDAWNGSISNGCFLNGTQCVPFWSVTPPEILGPSYRGNTAARDIVLLAFARLTGVLLSVAGTPSRIDTIAGNLRELLADSVSVTRSPGVATSPYEKQTRAQEALRISAAVAAAAAADVCVVTLTAELATESRDRESIGLPPPQSRMLEAVATLGKPLVCVLLGDGALSSPSVWQRCTAALHGFVGGQGGGWAVASALVGHVNPSGALPVTIYDESYTTRIEFTSYSLRDPPGRGYRFLAESPAFPFGHSLSYTRWSLQLTSLVPNRVTVGFPGVLRAKVNVSNVGARAGGKAILLFMRRRGGKLPWPKKWLVAFSKVRAVKAGAHTSVSLEFSGGDAWRQWDATVGAAGHYDLLLGTGEEVVGSLAVDAESVAS